MPDGSFRLAGLAEQPHTVFADASASGRFATAAAVQPGGRAVVLVLRPAARLLVRLVDSDKRPIAGGRVVISQVDGARLAYGSPTSSDESGAIQMLAPAGALQLEAYKEMDAPGDGLQGSAVARAAPGSTITVELRLGKPTTPR